MKKHIFSAVFIGALAGMAVCAYPVQAQTQNLVQQAQQQEAQHQKNEAIQQCIVYANRADMTSVALGVPFDAYVSRDGRIMIYGSPQARFEFQKCMNDAGYPIYPKN